MMSRGRLHRLAVIPGDGIGQEVVPAALRCLELLAGQHGFDLRLDVLDWGSDRFRTTGRMMPVDGIDILAEHDAIVLGAVGAPDIDDVETLWGLLIPIRREFDQYVNLRPVRSFEGIPTAVRNEDPIDLVIVRENVEGEYSQVGGRVYRGRDNEIAIQDVVFTRQGVARVARYAARLAQRRGGHLVSATKSNGIVHTMPFWDEVVDASVRELGDVSLREVLIDALAAELVRRPASFDVIVASNLFGDILSDLTAAIAGSIGIAPSANLDPEGRYPSMFEPVHGSAPDIAGHGVANPVGAMWSSAMLLDHLGEHEAGRRFQAAFTNVLAAGHATVDLGGVDDTAAFVDRVMGELSRGVESRGEGERDG